MGGNPLAEPRSLPPLWLFTDAERLPDPLPAIRRLPPGLAGIVLRHDRVTERLALARAVARLCRARRLALSVAGDWRLAASLGAGLHLRGGIVPRAASASVPRLTGSAHNARQAARCRGAGVCVIFLSPVFATASHPGAAALGPLRWAALARLAGPGAAALGGIGGRRVVRLPPACRAIGAIDALLA